MHMKIKKMHFDKLGLMVRIGVRRAKTGHLCRLHERLLIILLFLAFSGVSANGHDQDAAKKVVYQVFEKHDIICGKMLVPGTLDKAKRKELRDELAGIDTSLFPGEEKLDLDEWRDSLFAVLDKPPKSASESVDPILQLWLKCMAVLANYDITSAMAKADGYPQLTEKIDGLHNLAKEMLFAKLNLDTKALKELTPLTRAFVEYFYISTILAGPENRNPIARSALLSMKPGEIKEEAAKPPFLDVHKSLLFLSHGANGKFKPFPEGAGITRKPLVFLCDVLKKGLIEDAEIKKVSADENLLLVVKKLREIGKDDKCISIAP